MTKYNYCHPDSSGRTALARGRPFQKGQSGNAGGRPRKDRIVTEFQNRKTEDFVEQMQRYLDYTKDEMKADLSRKDATMFEIVIGRVILDAADGNKDARQALFERCIGKVKDKIEHSSGDNAPQIIISLPDNQRGAPPQLPPSPELEPEDPR